jgi:hypothetical protein
MWTQLVGTSAGIGHRSAGRGGRQLPILIIGLLGGIRPTMAPDRRGPRICRTQLGVGRRPRDPRGGLCPHEGAIRTDEWLELLTGRGIASLGEGVQQTLCVRPQVIFHDDLLEWPDGQPQDQLC